MENDILKILRAILTFWE